MDYNAGRTAACTAACRAQEAEVQERFDELEKKETSAKTNASRAEENVSLVDLPAAHG